MMDLDLPTMPTQTLRLLSGLQKAVMEEEEQVVADVVAAGSPEPEARAPMLVRVCMPG